MCSTRSACPKGPVIDDAVARAALKDTALLLVTHGSAEASAQAGVAAIVEGVRDRGVVGEVAAGFYRHGPSPAQAAAGFAAPKVVVVPLLATYGRILSAVRRDLLESASGPRVMMCPPIGLDPAMPDLVAQKAEAVVRREGLGPERTTLLLAGHGGFPCPTVRATVSGIVSRLEGRFGQAALAFLSEEPGLAAWPALARHPNVIVVPFLFSAGRHASADIPRLLGAPERPLDGTPHEGRRVWVTTPVADHSLLVGVVIAAACRRVAAVR